MFNYIGQESVHMPLTSYRETPGSVIPILTVPVLDFSRGTPDVGKAAGVADQAMYELGLAGPDRERDLENVTNDFNSLAEPGYNGRLHILPHRSVTFEHILATAEGKRKKDTPRTYVYDDLWTPSSKSYTRDELNAGPAHHAAHLAIFRSTETVLLDFDPVLHHLNKPYDNYKTNDLDVNPDGLPTQLKGLEADKVAMAELHPGFYLDALDHRAFAFMALMDRIRGVESEEQILNRGTMNIPKLGRRTVWGGRTVVGNVFSEHGRLCLNGLGGYARPAAGVGVSIGLTEA